MPVRSGPICGPFAAVLVALGAVRVNTFLPAADVAGLREDRLELLDHLLPVGVGQPAAEGEQLLRPLGELLVRVRGEGRALIEREHVEAERALLDGVEEGPRRVGLGEHEPQRGGPHGRRQVLELADDRGPERPWPSIG